MSIKIAHSSINENGKISNGQAGDNNGKEVCIRAWWDKDWDFVIRFKDKKLAEKMAQAMEAMVANDNVGYGQDRRNTLLIEAEKVGWNIAKITTPCECDCSSAATVAAICAGVPKNAVYVGGNCATTRTLRTRLNDTGLVQITSEARLTGSDDYAIRGDIYLKEGSHVIVALEDGPKVNAPSVVKPETTYKNGDIIQLKPNATYYNGKAIPSWVFKKTLYYRGTNSQGIKFSTLKIGAVTGVITPDMILTNQQTENKVETTAPTPAVKTYKNGDIIQLKPNATYYNGKAIPAWVLKKTLYYRGTNSQGIKFSILKVGAVTGVITPDMIL